MSDVDTAVEASAGPDRAVPPPIPLSGTAAGDGNGGATDAASRPAAATPVSPAAPTEQAPPAPASAAEPGAATAAAPAAPPTPAATAADGDAADAKAPSSDGTVPSTGDATPSEPAEPATALDLIVVDSAGRFISGLPLRVMRYGDSGKVLVVEASTNGKGAIPSITTLPVGTRFEVQIKNDRGIYMMGAIGTVQSQQMTGNLMLPHQRFEFATYSHDGAPGTAEKAKQSTASKHTQQADGKVDVARNATDVPSVALNRTEQGNPKGIVSSGNINMLGQNRMTASNPTLGLEAPEKVKALIDFGMEQLTWVHPSTLVSQTIIEQMKRSTYTHESRPKALGYAKSIGRCAKYVKIALWKAGYIPSDSDFDPGTSSASRLGPGLLRAGFADVTASLPDARWAAPGDIIVYRKIGAPDADGHIDIRTYDGYLSDFWDSYLPVSKFEVTGIYRKYHDPLPEKRMRAFLKVIRSREAETLFVNSGDAASYTALPMPKKGPPPTFSDFKQHPFDGTNSTWTPAGGYGITVKTWRSMLQWVSVAPGKDRFSPEVQDRMAIAIMELHPGQGYGSAGWQTTDPTSLALIRQGKVHEAATQLATRHVIQWPSLPGGSQTKYTFERFDEDYGKFLAELG